MANLPVPASQSSAEALSDGHIEAIVELIAKGKRPPEIARLLAPNSKARQKYWRRKLWRLVASDQRLANEVALRARAELMMGLITASHALSRRASTGRPDAIKLLFEASGFHNPRVQHEHSGEVNIKISMPRPKRYEPEDPVVDAEVVED